MDSRYTPGIAVLLIVIILAAFVRFVDLGTHFTHIDDIGVASDILKAKEPFSLDDLRKRIYNPNLTTYYSLKKIIFRKIDQAGLLGPLLARGGNLGQFVIIPLSWTYAPLQFLITPLLISRDQTYRQVLFWGRFPSFIFAVLGLFLLVLLYRRFNAKAYFGEALFALTLLAFSWENIIYAKHMSSYGIGVAAAIVVVHILWSALTDTVFSPHRFILTGLCLALISYAQYQVLLFIPAGYATLFLFYLSEKKGILLLIKRFLLSGITFLLSILPLFFFFHGNMHRAINWQNVGWNNEFLFDPAPFTSIGSKISYAIYFYLKNSLLVMQSNLLMIPERDGLAVPIVLFFVFLFLCGITSFIRSENKPKKYLGLFFILYFATWYMLVFFRKLTLSPTRHTLIFLPIIAVVITEGLSFSAARIKYSLARLSCLLSALFIVLFFMNFNQALKQRHDLFDAGKIKEKLVRYNVDTIIADNSAKYNMNLIIKELPGYDYYVNTFNQFEQGYWFYKNKQTDFQSIAYISQEQKIGPGKFEEIRGHINSDQSSLNTFRGDFSEYREAYSELTSTDTKIDFSRRVPDRSKTFYFTILEKKRGI